MSTSHFSYHSNHNMSYLVHSEQGFYVAIENTQGRWQIVNEKFDMSRAVYVDPPRADCLTDKQRDKPLALILYLTDQCNLHCSYCKFSSRKDELQKMATNMQAVRRSLKNLIEDHNPITISFQGGEPMLAYKEIDGLCAFLKDNYPLKNLHIYLQSNGTIVNDQIIEMLKQHKISCGISLDGPELIHDRNRKFFNSKGTYKTVRDNLYQLLDSGINLGVISVINTPKDIEEIYNHITNTLNLDSFYFKPLEFDPSMQVSLLDRQQYYRSLLDEQMNLLNNMVERYHLSGRKTTEQFLNFALSKIIKGIVMNHSCYKTPSCGSLEDIMAINRDGSISSCPGLRGIKDPEQMMLIKNRMNRCIGCHVSTICIGGCCASFLSAVPNQNSTQRLCQDFEILCSYNRELIEQIFLFLRGKLGRVLEYYRAH